MKHKKHKKVVYPDQNLICELCDPPRSFKNYQGLRGHRRMIHGILDPIIANSGPEVDPGAKSEAKSNNTIETLKEENELLKLQIKNRQLTAQFPASETRPQDKDMMAQLGLGSITGPAQEIAQKRVLGIRDQSQAQTWLDKLLGNPAGLKVAIDGLRGILSVNHNEGSGLSVLRELGIDLKSLWERSQAPRSGTLQIAGMDLQGASLTPSLLVALLDYKAKTESAQKEYEGKKEMSDSLSSLIKIITPELIAKFSGGRRGNGAAGTISQEIMPEPEIRENVLICDSCGTENPLPADLVPGQTVKCQGENCPRSWMVQAPPAAQKQRKKKQVVEVQEPPTSIACEGCGQMLAIEGKPLGSELVCPICQRTQVLMSPDIPLPAESAEEQGKFLHR